MADSKDYPPQQPKTYWLDQKENIDKLVYALYTVCGALFVADFFYHKHVHFGFENWIGFYGIYGFVSYVGLIFTAKLFRRLVKRREDYYDD